MVGNPSDSDFDDDSDVSDFGEFDDEFDEYEDDVTYDMEENKLFTHTEFSNVIDIGRIIAIYSSQTVNEPVFLCKGFEKNTQMSTFLMIMIIIFLQAKFTFIQFDAMFNTN